jgi:hypothetical protein
MTRYRLAKWPLVSHDPGRRAGPHGSVSLRRRFLPRSQSAPSVTVFMSVLAHGLAARPLSSRYGRGVLDDDRRPTPEQI